MGSPTKNQVRPGKDEDGSLRAQAVLSSPASHPPALSDGLAEEEAVKVVESRGARDSRRISQLCIVRS
jgi:hypothetical protein